MQSVQNIYYKVKRVNILNNDGKTDSNKLHLNLEAKRQNKYANLTARTA